MLVDLPRELWDSIVDLLAFDYVVLRRYVRVRVVNKKCLRACQLTCKTWQPRAKFRLYKHVELNDLKSIALFARTVTEAPEICTMVQELEFRIESQWSSTGKWITKSEIPFPPSLVPQFTRLESFTLVGFTDDWEAAVLVADFANAWAIHKQLRTLSLDIERFPTVADLARVLWSSPRLEELTLIGIRGWHNDNSPIDSAEYPPVYCQNLSSVVLKRCGPIDRILPLLGTSIRKLAISVSEDESKDTFQAMEALRDLRSLTLIIGGYGNPSWAVRALSLVRSTHIEELVLDTFYLNLNANGLGFFSHEGLDDLLCNSPFDNIRCLKLVLWTLRAYRNNPENVRDMVQVTFPRCYARGIIEVELQSR